MSHTLSVPAFYYIFRDICRSLHACGRVENIGKTVVPQIARAFQAQGAVFQLLQRQSGEPLVSIVHRLGESYSEAQTLLGPEQILEICTNEKVAVIDSLDAGLDSPEQNQPGQRLVAAPLALQGDLAGFLCLVFDRHQELTAEELDFLADLALQCSHAIDKAQVIEKQKQQFEQLAHQTERLTALGRMATGVAHELNNPLSSILLYSSNMLKKVPAGEFLHQGLEIIIQETKRCKIIIQELQEFSRSKEPKKIVGNINTVLSKVIYLLENEFRRRSIRLHQDLADSLPNMLIDIGQMQQVFANLLINASEAVNSHGEISVSTRFDQTLQNVSIEISDTGAGIPREYLGRIYEPFFSTKPKGTGLGLTVTYDFVMNHQGDLQVASEPGQGTRFTITIPVILPGEPPRTAS